MANKQVQSFEEYVFGVELAQSPEYECDWVGFLSEFVDLNGEHRFVRTAFADLFEKAKDEKGLLTKDNIVSSLDSKYLSVSNDAMGRCVSFDSVYSTNDSRNRGVYFDAGITLNFDKNTSWMGWGSINPSLYGNTTSSIEGCNIFKGTFSMQKVYVDDLWVKNLHTAESDSSDGDKTIQNLTVGKFIPSEITGFIDVDGNFCFNSNNESGTLSFENGGFKLSKDLTISGDSGSLSAALVSTNELSPRSMNSDGEFLTYMYGGFSFVKNFPNQRYLIAGTDDNAVFNSNGGLTKIYSQTEIDTKIKSLEARIAALEAK